MAHKILIVEDDIKIAAVYETFLKKQGYEIEVVNDGESAITKVHETHPDLVILDILLPKIDGLSVLKKLKTTAEYSRIPVLIASNIGSPEEINMGMTLGADDYIIKSNITLDYLLLKIKSLIH